MAEGEDICCPQSINTSESNDYSTATVKLEIPNLVAKKSFMKKMFGSKSDPGDPEVDVKFESQSFELNAAITHKGKVTKYHYRCNKLPGEIDIEPGKSRYVLQKGMVIVTLVKMNKTTWAVKLSENGLDQEPSD